MRNSRRLSAARLAASAAARLDSRSSRAGPTCPVVRDRAVAEVGRPDEDRTRRRMRSMPARLHTAGWCRVQAAVAGCAGCMASCRWLRHVLCTRTARAAWLPSSHAAHLCKGGAVEQGVVQVQHKAQLAPPAQVRVAVWRHGGLAGSGAMRLSNQGDARIKLGVHTERAARDDESRRIARRRADCEVPLSGVHGRLPDTVAACPATFNLDVWMEHARKPVHNLSLSSILLLAALLPGKRSDRQHLVQGKRRIPGLKHVAAQHGKPHNASPATMHTLPYSA